MKLTPVQAARIRAAHGAIDNPARHAEVLQWLLVVDPDATADDVLRQLDTIGYDPNGNFTADLAERYLRMSLARFDMTCVAVDDEERADALGIALPLFDAAPGRGGGDDQHQKLPDDDDLKGEASFSVRRSASGSRTTRLQPASSWTVVVPSPTKSPSKQQDDAGAVDLANVRAAMRMLPIKRELTPLLISKPSSSAALLQRAGSSERLDVDGAGSRGSPESGDFISFDRFSSWLRRQMDYWTTPEAAKVVTVMLREAAMSLAAPGGGGGGSKKSGLSPTRATKTTRLREQQHSAEMSTRALGLSRTGVGWASNVDDSPSSPGGKASPHRRSTAAGLRSFNMTSSSSMLDGSWSAEEDDSAGALVKLKADELYRKAHLRAVQPVNVQVPPARRLPPPPQLIRNTLDRTLLKLAGSTNVDQPHLQHQQQSPMSSRSGLPPKSLPYSSPLLHRNRASYESEPSPPIVVSMGELDETAGSPRSAASRPNRTVVERPTVASTARQAARRREFPDEVVRSTHSTTTTTNNGSSTPRRHPREEDNRLLALPQLPSPRTVSRQGTTVSVGASGSIAAAAVSWSAQKQFEDPEEAARRANRMRFFSNQALFTQPFRSEFRNANLAPPADSLVSPADARKLRGADPYQYGRSSSDPVAADADESQDTLMDRWTQ